MDQPENVTKPTFIERQGMDILRISVGIVFFWFGFLKFFGSTSPAEEIASRTISTITFDLMHANLSMPLLAMLECIIGLGLLTKKYMRFVIPLLYFQMAGAVLPLFIFLDDSWTKAFVPTLLGQYIIKNCILISAGIVLGVVSKGGKLIADPVVAKEAKKVEDKVSRQY
ncbi:MAG TPA: DoxX family membrane protein [Flavobacterium sp.]|jgi:uncharacterized membrane protein YphA (DoxX/SURF4 family)